MNWQKYNKLWAVIAGLALLFFTQRSGLHIPGVADAVAELVISTFTAWGVFKAANRSNEPDDTDEFRGV